MRTLLGRFGALAAVLVLVVPGAAQVVPRPTVTLNFNFYRFGTAADDDLFAVAYGDFFLADDIWIRVADGRGAFGPEIRLNPASSTSFVLAFDTSVQVVGSSVYVVWTEALNPTYLREPYIASSHDRGATFSAPLLLDKGLPFGTGAVEAMALAVTPGTGGQDVHVLMRTSPDRTNGDLYLTSSHDGGRTFAAPVPVSTGDPLGADVDDIVVTAEGGSVLAVWLDDRNDLVGGTNDIYFRRSLDGGATWAAPERQLNTVTGGLQQQAPLVEIAKGAIAVAWSQSITGASEVRATHSGDGGASFTPDGTVGGYDPALHHAFASDLHPQDGALYLAFTDNRQGATHMWLARSDDHGLSWNPDVRLPRVGGSVGVPHLAGAGDVLGVLFDSLGAGATAFSMDRGQTWSPAVMLGSNGVSRHPPRIEYDPVYDNFVCFWTEAPGGGDSELYTTGYRPQRLSPRGFVGGATTISFRLDGFSGRDRHAMVLGAFAPGSATLPLDGRDLGLAPDPLFALSAGLAGSVLGAGISPGGSGRTPDIPITLPEGHSLVWVGLSLGGSSLFGQITDVVRTNF